MDWTAKSEDTKQMLSLFEGFDQMRHPSVSKAILRMKFRQNPE